jgi:hypothetical protein
MKTSKTKPRKSAINAKIVIIILLVAISVMTVLNSLVIKYLYDRQGEAATK